MSEDKTILEITKQLRLLNRLTALTLVKDLDTQAKRIDYLFNVGLNNEDIVDILGSGKGKLDLAKHKNNYEIFGILRNVKFQNKEIASLFGITESTVKSTLSQYKEEIKRLVDGRSKL